MAVAQKYLSAQMRQASLFSFFGNSYVGYTSVFVCVVHVLTMLFTESRLLLQMQRYRRSKKRSRLPLKSSGRCS